MKTPREILLDRHCAAGPKLDAVRKNALATLNPAPNSVTPARVNGSWPYRAAWVLWQELIFPCRRIWAGLAAIWVVILFLNFPGGGKPARAVAQTTPPDREVLALLREQREMLAQFIEPSVPSPAVPNKPMPPHSEIPQTIILV